MTDRRVPPGTPMDDAAAAPPESLMGGRYRVGREIGRGAAGRVYLAFDTRLQRNVAIKELLTSQGRGDSASYGAHLERFQREARAGGVVLHPNIIAVYELAIDADGNYYLIMEYVEGTSLQRLLSQVGTLPVERAVQIAVEVAKALEVVHERDIVHRDVKPANIMLTNRGVTKLADFGIAQVGNESQRAQAIIGHPGTPLYMSPEQRTEMGYLNGRSDLYSLGAVLYEMLAGEPYGRRREPLSTVRPDLSPQLVAIIDRLMMPDPADRYGNAGEVVTALESLSDTRRAAPMTDASTRPRLDDDKPRSEAIGTAEAVTPADAPPAVPVALGALESRRSLELAIQSPDQDRATSPRTGQGKRAKRGAWVGIGGAVAAVAIAIVALVAFAGQRHSPTPASTPVGGTVVPILTTSEPSPASGTAPVRTAVPPPTASVVAAGSPVPENAYVVADARNLISYAYPKNWKVGGVSESDTDIVIGFTNLTPFAYASIGREDITPSTTLDAYADDYIARRFRKDPDWKPGSISKQNTRIAGQDARIVDFLDPNTAGSTLAPKGVTVYTYFILTLHDGRAWTFSYATANDQKAIVQAQFDVLATTFAFCPPSGCTRQPTAPTVAPGQMAQTTDAANQLMLTFPADWFVQPNDKVKERNTTQGINNVLEISSPDGVLFTVAIYDQRGTVDEEIKAIIEGDAKSPTHTFMFVPTADVRIGGEPGKSVNYTYLTKSDPSAKPRNGAFWVVNHNGKEFFLESADIKARRVEIDKIIGSIAFIGPASSVATPAAIRTATPTGAYAADFSKWPSDDQSRRGYDAASGEYRVGSSGSTYEPNAQKIADFTLEVDMRQTAGPDTALYGLSFRVQPQNPGDKTSARYNFLITSQGYYRLDLVKADGTSSAVLDYALGPPGAIKTGVGAVNHLSVTCKGEKITLAINGTTLTTVTATLTQPGNVGVTVFTPPSVTGVEAAFKNLHYAPA